MNTKSQMIANANIYVYIANELLLCTLYLPYQDSR